jgi:hypothetical protein
MHKIKTKGIINKATIHDTRFFKIFVQFIDRDRSSELYKAPVHIARKGNGIPAFQPSESEEGTSVEDVSEEEESSSVESETFEEDDSGSSAGSSDSEDELVRTSSRFSSDESAPFEQAKIKADSAPAIRSELNFLIAIPAPL